MICEMTQKLKLQANLFDKYWYRQREFQYIEGITVEQGAQFSNKDGEQRESNELAAGAKDDDAIDEDVEYDVPLQGESKKPSLDVNPAVKKLMDMEYKTKSKVEKLNECGPDVFGLKQIKEDKHHHHHHHHDKGKACTDCKDVFGQKK